MKKITFSLLLVLSSTLSFSQVMFEGFENTTGPDAAPSTNWTLGSGNWAVFDTNVGGTVNWSINPNSHTGAYAAYMNRQNIASGITTEEYLATPMVTVPANGKLEFYSRSFTAGNQGTLYQVKVASASSPQNNPSSYTIVLAEFSENQLSPIFNVNWKKSLDLSGFAGQNIYIAFVNKYTQPSWSLTGDRWLLDDVSVIDGLGCNQPSNLNVTHNQTNLSYTMTWNVDNSTSWEVLAIPCSQGFPFQNQTGIPISTNSYSFTGLIENCYNFCVRSICSNGSISGWSINNIYDLNYQYTDGCVNLHSFIDNNNNSIYDVGDLHFFKGNFSYNSNTGSVSSYQTYNHHQSYCSMPSTTANLEFEIIPEYLPYYSLTTLSYNNISFPSSQTLNFPVTLTQSFADLEISSFSSPLLRAGFDYEVRFTYRNNGSIPLAGTINFVKDPQVSIVSVSLAPTDYVLTANGFSYITDVLDPGYGGTIRVKLSIPPIPTVAIGDLLTNSVTFTPNTGTDVILSNNSFSETKAIVAAYDPNNKSESHGGQISFDEFTSDDYLYYTINFQNLGNASAIDVRIEDALDSKLDESTIQMIESSHNYTMERTGSGLTWRFDNIQLLPAFVSEELSKGFVFFKVKPKPGYAVGDIIPNTADIYFDSNPAIVTNTFNTVFVQALSTTNFEANNFVIFPNPTDQNLTISLQNTYEMIDSIAITDVLGKTIRNIKDVSSNQLNIDVADVLEGVYFVEIITQNNVKQVKKLIKK